MNDSGSRYLCMIAVLFGCCQMNSVKLNKPLQLRLWLAKQPVAPPRGTERLGDHGRARDGSFGAATARDSDRGNRLGDHTAGKARFAWNESLMSRRRV
jgi:hypothetical protein